MAVEVIPYERSKTLSRKELVLLQGYTHVGQSRHLSGHDLTRARRILNAGFGFLEPGKLGDRYFTITQAGMDFVDNVGRSGGDAVRSALGER